MEKPVSPETDHTQGVPPATPLNLKSECVRKAGFDSRGKPASPKTDQTQDVLPTTPLQLKCERVRKVGFDNGGNLLLQ